MSKLDSSGQSEVMLIGEYQLANLQRNMVRFIFLDLRSQERSEAQGSGHWLLANAQPISSERVLEHVKASGLDLSHPIVVICEDGRKSQAAGEILTQNGYINVYAIIGGAAGLQLN